MAAPERFYEGLGASICAAILGEDPHKSPYQLWTEFVDPESRPNLDDNEAVEAGIIFEPSIAAWAAKKWNLTIDYQPGRLLVHPRLDFMQCHPDAMVVGEPAGLECKNRGFQALRLYRDLEEAEEEMDRAQPSEVLQCHASMAVTGATHWYLAVAVAGQKLLRFKIARDEAICAAIEERYATFWECVRTGVPPPPINSSDCAKLWPTHRAASFIDGDEATAALIEDRKRLKGVIKGAEQSLEIVEFRLKTEMRDAEEIRVGGRKALSWKTQPRAQFKLDEFRAEHPELAEAFTEKKTVRVMR